jgi:hypothetical protein
MRVLPVYRSQNNRILAVTFASAEEAVAIFNSGALDKPPANSGGGRAEWTIDGGTIVAVRAIETPVRPVKAKAA